MSGAIGRSAGIPAWPPKRHPGRIRLAAHVKGDADMLSQAMRDLIDAFRDGQKASASQALPTLEERRAAFAPGAAFIRCLTTCWCGR